MESKVPFTPHTSLVTSPRWLRAHEAKSLPRKCMARQETLPPGLKSEALCLVTLASKSVCIAKGKDDMAFIALIKTGVKTCNSDLK